MKITGVEVRACSIAHDRGRALKLRDGKVQLGFVVLTVRTDEGVDGSSFGFGGRSPVAAAHIMAGVRDLLVGRDPLARTGLWHEYRYVDRWWNVFPIWAYGPVDVALWDIAGKIAHQPIYELLGWCRDAVPTYASSMALGSIDEYVGEALAVKARGLHGYKVHPVGNINEDLKTYTAVREAVGDDFALMSDPVAAYSFDEALRAGHALEDLGYQWFEEPLFDGNAIALKRLADALDIPVVGTEVLAGGTEAITDYLSRGVVDVVRGDVSWKGGITGLLRVAAVAEAFGTRCEVHTAIYHALEVANLHVLRAIPNSTFFEVLWPLDDYAFGLRGALDIDADGMARPPSGPGLGIELDWDLIEDSTVAVL